MASKTEKRHTQRRKEEEKAAMERMKNLDEQSINALINYGIMQILYINDAAYNCCKQLGDELPNIPYKSNAVKKIYSALMKRWQVHRDILNDPGLDPNSVAALFGEMDEYVDQFVDQFQASIQDVLTREGVPNAHWVANVETANTMCAYAVQIAKDYVESIVHFDKRAAMITAMIANEPARVMSNMSTVVNSIHVKKDIDLKTEPTVQRTFKKFNKSFISPENFLKAQQTADAENAAEGRMLIM